MINNVFNKTVYQRYLTLEKNIKSNSNSFYDSYLDLLEATVKYILDDAKIEYDYSKPCGYLLNNDSIKDFYINKIGLDEKTYESLRDKIKKCNDSKHKKEKNVDEDAIVSSMRLYITFTNAFLKYKGRDQIEFNSHHFSSMFGEMEKTNEKLDTINKNVAELGETFKQAISAFNKSQQINNQPVTNNGQPQNNLKILSDFVKGARCRFKWFGTEIDFLKSLKKATLFLILFLAIGIIATVFTTVASGFYSTFSFFENIYLVIAMIMLFRLPAKDRFCDCNELVIKSKHVFQKDEIGLPHYLFKEKKFYKITRIVSYISALFNVIFVWTQGGSSRPAFCIIATIFEIAFLVFAVLSNAFYESHLANYYTIVYIEGKNLTTKEPVTMVATLIDCKMYEKEEFEEKFKLLDKTTTT